MPAVAQSSPPKFNKTLDYGYYNIVIPSIRIFHSYFLRLQKIITSIAYGIDYCYAYCLII